MERRLLLALSLSFLVLFAWQMTLPRHTGTEEGETASATGSGGAADQTAGAPPSAPESTGEGQAETPPAVEAPAATPPVERPGRVAADHEETLLVRTGVPVAEGGPKEPGHYELRFSNRGGRLTEVRFLDYVESAELDAEARTQEENWTPLLVPLRTAEGDTGSLLLEAGETLRDVLPEDLSQVLWKMEELPAPDHGARFTYSPGTGLELVKTIRVEPGTWHILLELSIRNDTADVPAHATMTLIPAGVVPPALGDRFYPEPRAVAVGRDKRGRYVLDHELAPSAKGDGGRLNAGSAGLVFAGVHNKYFAFFLRDTDGQSTLVDARWVPVVEEVPPFEERAPTKEIETEIQLGLDLPKAGTTKRWEWIAYAGPKDPDVMRADLAAHGEVLKKDLSTFATIGRFLLWVLRLFHRVFGNWGVAIIFLTVCVRGVLFPLNRRSQTSMARYQKKMKRVQPRLDEIKKRYANDSQKQREAQAKVMQEEGAFPPLGGCLPIFLQIPVFFGLFSALRTSWDLRQAGFGLWIHDLSIPDRLMRLDMQIPLGITKLDLTYLNLLPILMVVLWILQQRGMPQPADDQAKQMQKVMTFMPVLFGLFLYNYAAGLSLYMITQSSLGIVEQRFIKKMWPIDDAEPEKKAKKKGCAPFAGMMENLAEKQRQEMARIDRSRQGRDKPSPTRKRKR